MRGRALLIVALVLLLGLAAGLALYHGARLSKSPSVAGTTTGPSRKKRRRPKLVGPHHRAVPILMYHVVGPTPAGAAFPGLYVSRRDFAAQLRWLAKEGYHPVTLDAVDRYWRGLERLPLRPIVLSFDDGYRQQFTIAAPLLRRHRWPGVLNLEYAQLVHESLTGPMVRRMLADGWELDSHTMTHPDLTTVSAAALHWELTRSRELLQRRFGVPVHFFCYPMGKFDPRVVRAVQAAGYWGATTIRFGLARPSQLFTLARIRVDSGDGSSELARKLALAR